MSSLSEIDDLMVELGLMKPADEAKDHDPSRTKDPADVPHDDTAYYDDLNPESQNSADQKYQDYLEDILERGHDSGDRTGTGTIKSFGHQLRFDLQEGFPLLTTKAVWLEGIFHELMWFLRGQTNIRPLVEEGVSIWTDWPYEKYKEQIGSDLSQEEFEEQIIEHDRFADTWGQLGQVYGQMWREAPTSSGWGYRDQIARLIDGLRTHPDSRRHLVDAWDPTVHGIAGKTEDDGVALSPCHYGFQCFTRELSYEERYELWQESTSTENVSFALSKPPPGVSDEEAVEDRHELFEEEGIPRHALSLMWNQRSADSFLGLPFNTASYALLTHMLAQQVNMVPEELIFSGGDCHIYGNHLEQVEELLSRTGQPEAPTIELPEDAPENIEDYQWGGIELKGYDPHDPIEAEVAV